MVNLAKALRETVPVVVRFNPFFLGGKRAAPALCCTTMVWRLGKTKIQSVDVATTAVMIMKMED